MSYTSVAVLGSVCAVLLLVPTIGFMTNKKVTSLFDSFDQSEVEVALQN